MLSRWTDFLNADGEKPNRDREGEFAERQLPREQLMRLWEEGWRCVFDALAALTDAELGRIRNLPGPPAEGQAAVPPLPETTAKEDK